MTLNKQLTQLMTDARKHDGRTVHVDLPRGLRISLRIVFGGEIWLALSRTDTFPATAEWITVLKHFPGGAELIGNLQAGETNGRYWMQGKLQITPEMI